MNIKLGREIVESDMKEVIKILEILDNDSLVLVKGYLSALIDRQQLEKSRLAVI